MSKINSRSPYYVTHTISSSTITSVRLNLWIYTGTQTTSKPTAATYVLESTPINGSVQFDIANLVKDYFEPSHTSTEILWVDYRIDEYGTFNLDYWGSVFDEVGTSSESLKLYYESDIAFGRTPKVGTVMYSDLNRTTPVADTVVYYVDSVTDDSRIVTINQNANNGGLGEVVSVATDISDTATTLPVDRDFTEHSQEVTYIQEGTTTTQLEGFYGYGYFEDGANPQNDKPILLSSNHLLKLEGTDVNIPVNNNQGTFTANVNGDDGSLLGTISDSAATNSSNVVSYYNEDDNVNNIEVNGEVYYIETVKECKYNPYKVTFINKYGALEDVWFFKNNKIDLNVETESFRRNIVSSGYYSLQDHQYHTLKKQGRETITLNSGFYPEVANETFRQLLFSDYAWITHEGNVLPIQIKDSSFNFKTRLTDRVINYTMQFEFAFDKINTVR